MNSLFEEWNFKTKTEFLGEEKWTSFLLNCKYLDQIRSFKFVIFSECARFRRITGDTCVNGTEKDFLPVLTSCPVKGEDDYDFCKVKQK